jgi:carbon-monoxide dehydrogenase large subunit
MTEGRARSDGLSADPGATIGRREDGRLLRGMGRFTSDIDIRGALHACFVRSPHPHALIGEIDLAPALAAVGVVAAYTGSHLAEAGVAPLQTTPPPRGHAGERRALALGRVRFEGEPVAIVIGESADAAAAGARRVRVSYDSLPFVTTAPAAAATGAPTVHDDVDGNVGYSFEAGDQDAVRTAIEKAHSTVAATIRMQRVLQPVVEPRACVAGWTAGHLVIHATCENPHVHRLRLADCLPDVTEQRIRVATFDTGGAFGARSTVQPEVVAVCWAARALDRPVRWTATREETILTDSHGGDQLIAAELAFDAENRITGLRIRSLVNLGACLASPETVHRAAAAHDSLAGGPYRIPAIHTTVTGTFSHTAPTGCFRGSSPDPTFPIERLLSLAARQLGADPARLRRRNLADPAAAYTNDYAVHDIVKPVRVFDDGLERVGYTRLREEQAQVREGGGLRGIGLACQWVRGSAGQPARSAVGVDGPGLEGVLVRVHPTGRVTVFTGRPQRGEGQETTYAQVAASALGLDLSAVTVVGGDTDTAPYGPAGTGRAGALAVERAALRVLDKASRLAARVLGVGAAEVHRSGAGFEADSGRRCGWVDAARAAYAGGTLEASIDPGLEAVGFGGSAEGEVLFGVHLSVVDIDPDTGVIKILRHVVWDDTPSPINPSIVAGQLHGAAVQGMSQALWSGLTYGTDGRLRTRSLATCAIARPAALPRVELFGLRNGAGSGAGSADPGGAASAAMAAVVNAVVDAVTPLGVAHIDPPLTAEKVWLAVRSARRE